MPRFAKRDMSVIAISVDAPHESLRLIDRLGLSFSVASDPALHIVKAFNVQNPGTRELALHAVYIVDKDRRIFYRKVALRRPTSEELIDAIDAHRGTYPQKI
jgi:peroxiredoxin